MSLIKNLQRIALTGMTALLLAMPAAYAQDPKTACDPEYMEALKARAWMEAQREITQNQNLISKPDSVLQYTCFHKFLDNAASNFILENLQRPFSETDEWQTTGFSSTTTDQALSKVVGQALKAYLDKNFNHKALGGRLEFSDFRSTHVDTVTGGGDGGNYVCENMKKVWEDARCQNFISVKDADGFYDFDYYKSNEPRDHDKTKPSDAYANCRGRSGALTDTTLDNAWDLAIKAAFNNEQDKFVLPANKDNKIDADPEYKEDDVITHLDLIMPENCTDLQPIKTGITISRGDEQKEDMVCPAPGCTFDGSECK